MAPGDLVVGADSHTVMCGAVGAFATGIGSADLAGLFLSGQLWLRVPATVRVNLDGELPTGVGAKDLALVLVRMVGSITIMSPGRIFMPAPRVSFLSVNLKTAVTIWPEASRR